MGHLFHIAARAVFSMTGTSVPSECLFSRAGIIYAARRSRLTPKHANDLLLAHDYLKFKKQVRLDEIERKEKFEHCDYTQESAKKRKLRRKQEIETAKESLNWTDTDINSKKARK